MTDLHIRPSGSWKAIDDCQVRVASAWKQVETIYVNISGVWKEVWANVAYAITGATILHGNTGDSNVRFRVNSDGTTDEAAYAGGASYSQINALTDWVIPNSESATTHYVQFTRDSGDTVGFIGTLTTWQALSANREIGYSISSGSRGGVYTCNIATDSGGTNIVASGTINLDTDAT